MLYRKTTLAVLLALIFLSFFGTLCASALMLPGKYDWRSRVISNLLSPRDNPGHYWLAACGTALAGLLTLPFAGYLRRHLQTAAPRAARLTCLAFVAGIIALICACIVVPQHMHGALGVRRLHEFLARSSAAFIALAMLSACWCAWKGCGQSRLAAHLFWTWSLLTVLPLLGILLSECFLLVAQSKTPWAIPIRSALRHSVFWHLGFWEWTGAVAVFVFLCAAVLLTPAWRKRDYAETAC
jgi:hypothetical protein